MRSQLASQLSALQAEFDGVTVRLEEETEAAQNARAQLQRLQTDYQQLKSKYDKEILALTEELDDTRSVTRRSVLRVLGLFYAGLYGNVF